MDHSKGIGEMVDDIVIYVLSKDLYWSGEELFFKKIYDGMYAEVAYAYTHPCDEMRKTRSFNTIQRAFINAYV